MKMKKNCELCKGLARMHCESDQASLCWSCDFKVHAANFLVARHSRTLLCHVCQSPTPWTATGTKLGPTVSVCDNCVHNCSNLKGEEEDEEIESEKRDEVGFEEEVEGEDDDVDEEKKDEDVDNEDNQVVPWSPTAPPPLSSSSSNSDEEAYYSSSSSLSSSRRDRREPQRKRMRKNDSDLWLNVNRCCTSSRENANKMPEAVAEAVDCGGKGRVGVVDSFTTTGERSLKSRRLTGASSWAIVESVQRLHDQKMRSSAAVADFCRLSEDPSAVDFESSECFQP